MTDTTTEVVKRGPFTDDVLRGIDSWEELGKFMVAQKLNHENFGDYGPGLIVVNKSDKEKLIGVPFMILDARLGQKGDSGDFASVVIVTKHPVEIGGREGVKFVVNDGSTGIMRQLEEIAAQRGDNPFRPIYVENGLRKSDYIRRDENGQPILNKQGEPERATTYYLA